MLPIVLIIVFMFAVNSCSKEELFEEEDLAYSLKSAPVTVSESSASGHGWLDYGDGLKRQFTFHANVMPNGTVKGSGVITYTSGELVSMFNITCMVVEGNSARMAGVVTKSKTAPDFIGTGCFFAVQDNGEGKDGTLVPDIMTMQFVNLPLPADCDAYLAEFGYPPIFEIEGGNIQVKP